MNYFRIYNSLITRAKSRTERIDHGEMHHIKPRCMGGGDQEDNLVLLTYREHFIAHLLLVKMYPDNTRLYFAFNCFSAKYRSGPFYSARKLPELSGRMFEKMKLEAKVRMNQDGSWRNCSKRVMNTIWINNGQKNKRVQQADLQVYLEQGWIQGRTYHKRVDSPETHVKIALKRKGSKLSAARVQEIKLWNKEHPHCWVSKGRQSKQIYLSELSSYLKQGWIRGRHSIAVEDPSNYVYVRHDSLVKKILKEEQSLYLDSGWVLCSKEDYKSARRNTYSYMSWMTNGEKDVRVSREEISIFKKKGYKEGRSYLRKDGISC